MHPLQRGFIWFCHAPDSDWDLFTPNSWLKCLCPTQVKCTHSTNPQQGILWLPLLEDILFLFNSFVLLIAMVGFPAVPWGWWVGGVRFTFGLSICVCIDLGKASYKTFQFWWVSGFDICPSSSYWSQQYWQMILGVLIIPYSSFLPFW